MKIDWMDKLRHLLQVLAFCLVVATVQYAFQPERPYGPPVVYSLFIGSITWAVIDLGRELFPSSAETGWPRGWAGLALVIGGIAAGYLLGHEIADRLCLYFGFYPPGPNPNRRGATAHLDSHHRAGGHRRQLLLLQHQQKRLPANARWARRPGTPTKRA